MRSQQAAPNIATEASASPRRLQRLRYGPVHLTPHDLRHVAPSASTLVIPPFLAYDQAMTRPTIILTLAFALTGCADIATHILAMRYGLVARIVGGVNETS